VSRPPVVVVGLDCPTGLQTARIFAARDIEVLGVATNLSHPCVRTRRCRRVVEAAPGPEGVVTALLSLAEELEGPAVLIPCTDVAVLGIARHRSRLSDHYLMALPAPEVVEALMDKARFAQLAEQHRLPIPATRIVRTRADMVAVAAETSFPCVFKPSLKSVAWDGHVPAKAFIVDTPTGLLELYDRHHVWADAFVVQEWIEGGDTDHYTCDCYLARDGEALVTFCTRKLRQWPPIVGQACLSVENRNDHVLEGALKTLRAAGHHGQGYVEMKWDARTGRHVVIEANIGRPTGRSAAAEKAGVELLMTVYSDLAGLALPEDRTQRFRGYKWIHIRRDLQACAFLLLEGGITIREILSSWRGTFAFALFSLRDPVPFLADFTAAIRSVLPTLPPGRRAAMRPRTVRPKQPLELAPLEVPEPTNGNGSTGGDGGRVEVPAMPGAKRRIPRDSLITLTCAGIGLLPMILLRG